jgi:predicted phage gp36 major capsid-like protein
VRPEDVTENAAKVSDRWRSAREARRAELLPIEGAERFDGLQRFFAAVHRQTSERRLSRIAYFAERPERRRRSREAETTRQYGATGLRS